jgi:YrbI family 3-deoxy-D-manno-octulosonate 8-phosphate phosphatase
MKTVALIPVRGGSKSIPGKNIKSLGGRPLLHWTLEAAVGCPAIDAVYVSSDSPAIRESAIQFGHSKVFALDRAPETATDTASTESVMLDFAAERDFERIVLIQATSPLTTSDDLSGAIKHLDSTGADSLLTVTHEHRFLWGDQGDGTAIAKNYDPVKRPRRQDWSGELVENGAFYVCSREGLLRTHSRLHGKVAYWTMSGKTAVEIDTPEDWEILEALMQRRGSSSTPTDPRAASRRVPETLAKDLRLLITDVDGVLTDAGMYYNPEGDYLKKFNTRDGMGVQLWRDSGRAIVTGENSEIVRKRAEKLKIQTVHLGVSDKLSLVTQMLADRGLRFDQVAYIGDDLNDLEVMKRVGFAACPADAHEKIQAISHRVCTVRGGEGCFREFVEYLLGGN